MLAEFWYWYRDLKKKVSDLSDSDHEEVVMAEIGELSFEGLPLPTLDTKFYICGQEFEVRDALSLATHEVWYVAREVPDTPDGWRTPDVACTDGVREFALGFFCGVVIGMNTIMTITNIPLNGMIDNDGSIRCLHEIQTQEALQQFYQDVIEPQLLDELDDYLHSDYGN